MVGVGISDSLPQPTKARVRSLFLNGFDMTKHVTKISVYETIHKPYLTAKVTIIDNNYLIENMGLVGGEPCSFAFDGGDYVYENTLYILKVKGMKSNQSLRSQIYDIDLIGIEYYNDKQNIVQRSFKQIPGTAAIAAIHGQFIGGGLNIVGTSMGPIDKESYIAAGTHPFKAINDIRQRLNFGGSQSGNCLYFKNKFSMNLGPLEAFMAQATADQTFTQKATWGINWFDVIAAQNAIIAAQAEVDGKDGGRSGMQDVASSASQEKKVWDNRTKKLTVDKGASKISARVSNISSLLSPILGGGGAGGHGGKPNYTIMDGARLPTSTDPSNMAEAQSLFASLVKNGPRLTVKVPIQSGILVTVGRGCWLNLIPPIGDLDNVIGNSMTGMYMLTDLCHELFLDDTQMNATTTFQCAKTS
jgi:hypothetical protein